MSYFHQLGAGESTEVEMLDYKARFDSLDKELARLNATAERDLFFRKIATAAAIVGVAFGALKIVDLLTYLERRRARTGESP